jgi:hypothetical protein
VLVVERIQLRLDLLLKKVTFPADLDDGRCSSSAGAPSQYEARHHHVESAPRGCHQYRQRHSEDDRDGIANDGDWL